MLRRSGKSSNDASMNQKQYLIVIEAEGSQNPETILSAIDGVFFPPQLSLHDNDTGEDVTVRFVRDAGLREVDKIKAA